MALTKTPIELSSTPGIVDNSNATAITIDASENVLVGTTSTSIPNQSSNTGIFLFGGGSINVARSGDECAIFNRLTSDGEIVRIQKDGSTVGSIGVEASDNFYIADAATNTGLNFKGFINPANSNGTTRDAAIDLGNSGGRFKDIYLSGGAYLGGTAAANKLEDYEEGTWTPTVSGCTLSVVRAFYTKIGNLVTLHFNFSVTATNNASVAMSIAGKPFVGSVADSESNGSLMVRYATIDANTINLSLYTYSRGATIEIYQSKSNTANWVTLRKNQLQASPATAFIGSITYETDS